MEVDKEEKENRESLDNAAERGEEGVDEDHGYLPEHDYRFPVVEAMLVAVVEETELLLGIV